MNPLVFIAWLPVIELLLLIAMAALFGFWFTLAWIVGTAVLGVVLLKRLSQRMGAIAGSSSRGSRPGWRISPPSPTEMPGMVASWVGAVLLILPGPLTDLVGFLLVIPALRQLALGAWVARHAERWASRRQGAGRVYEGEVVSGTDRSPERVIERSAQRDEPHP